MTGNRFDLISCAMDFCSFLIRSEIGGEIDQVILYGSVARGDFDEESDIDLFIDTKKEIEPEILKVLKTYELSETAEKWRLKGVKNPISVKAGNLKEWKLMRSVISDGIVLYGRFREMPEDVKYYLLLKLDFKGLGRNRKIRIWRKLYGYTQKIGSTKYTSKGLLSQVSGKKIKKGVIIVPVEGKDKIMDFLKKHKIKHSVYEIWSDTI